MEVPTFFYDFVFFFTMKTGKLLLGRWDVSNVAASII